MKKEIYLQRKALRASLRVQRLALAALLLTGISACHSSTAPSSGSPGNASNEPTNTPTGTPPETFSRELNSTSVFSGASIIQYWPLPIHNAGIAGETTSEVLTRFKTAVVGHGYLRVIVLCGTNDILQNKPNLVAEITANLRSMRQIAADAGIEVVLSQLPPATSGGVDLSPTIATVNAAIVSLAAEHGDLVVDFYTPLLGHPEYFPDGIHPNSAGYAVMEKALSATVLR